jgi:hypothetical protein
MSGDIVMIDTPTCSLLLSAVQGYVVRNKEVGLCKGLKDPRLDDFIAGKPMSETVAEAIAIVGGLEVPTGLRVTVFRQLWLDALAHQEKLDRPYYRETTP